MQLFVRIIDEGSFSAAARFMGMTPSSVSRHVTQLEHELGARLFHRTTRKQSLTEAGEIYLHHARRIAADVEDAKLAVSRLADTPSGVLHVTVEADFATAFIAPILPDFMARYPDVKIRLSMSASKADLVDSGLDLAVRIGHLDDSSLIARKIATSKSLVCASPAYLAKYGTPQCPDQLREHKCLSFLTSPGKSLWRFSNKQGPVEVPISGPLNASSLTFLKQAAVDGLGIIMVPSWMVQDKLERGELVRLLADFPLMPVSTPIHAVFAHNRHLAPKVRAFVDFLAEQMHTL